MGGSGTPITGSEPPEMRHPAHHRLRRQVESLRQEFLQDGRLPFTDVLTEEGLEEAVREIKAP